VLYVIYVMYVMKQKILLHITKKNFNDIYDNTFNSDSGSHISYPSHRCNNPVISIRVRNNSFLLLHSLVIIPQNCLI